MSDIGIGGRTANVTGGSFEVFLKSALLHKKYAYVEPAKFAPAMFIGQPIYTHKMKYGENIYGYVAD